MSNFVIQGYANLENVNANNMDLFYATMSAQLSTFFPTLGGTQGSICSGIGNIVSKFGQTGTGNVFNFENGYIRFLDQVTNLTTDISIKPCYASLSGSAVTVACPISVTQYYVVAVLSFNTPTDPFTTSTSVIISPTAMTLGQIAAQPVPSLYNPLFAITTTDGINYTIHIDGNCAFNYGYIIGNPFPDITDIAGLVTVIGTGGLVVDAGLEVNGVTTQIGALNVSGITTLINAAVLQNTLSVASTAIFKNFANFVDDGTSAVVSITRNTNARPGSTLSIVSESSVSGVVPGFSTLALIELSGSSAPTFGACYDFGTRWYLTTAVAGDAPAATNPKALAIMADLPVTQQFIGSGVSGGTFTLQATTTHGPFPAIGGCGMSGQISNAPTLTAPGNTVTYQIDLVGTGILATAPITNGSGTCNMQGDSAGLYYGIGGVCDYSSGINTLNIDGSNPSYSTASIIGGFGFSIIVR